MQGREAGTRGNVMAHGLHRRAGAAHRAAARGRQRHLLPDGARWWSAGWSPAPRCSVAGSRWPSAPTSSPSPATAASSASPRRFERERRARGLRRPRGRPGADDLAGAGGRKAGGVRRAAWARRAARLRRSGPAGEPTSATPTRRGRGLRHAGLTDAGAARLPVRAAADGDGRPRTRPDGRRVPPGLIVSTAAAARLLGTPLAGAAGGRGGADGLAAPYAFFGRPLAVPGAQRGRRAAGERPGAARAVRGHRRPQRPRGHDGRAGGPRLAARLQPHPAPRGRGPGAGGRGRPEKPRRASAGELAARCAPGGPGAAGQHLQRRGRRRVRHARACWRSRSTWPSQPCRGAPSSSSGTRRRRWGCTARSTSPTIPPCRATASWRS